MIDRFLSWSAIIYRNYRTSIAGLVALGFTTWQFLDKSISWAEAIVGWSSAWGLLMAKDGQTETEYNREHRAVSGSVDSSADSSGDVSRGFNNN